MKTFRQVCATLCLAALISLPVFGGEIGCPGMTSETAAPISVEDEVGFPQAMRPAGIPAGDVVTLDLVTEYTLDLLRSVLSLF